MTEYWGPNDDRQNNGLDIAHHFMVMLKGDRLFAAPMDHPKRVLDIGTGTGIWAIDMADAYPSTEIVGTDISPIQPTWVPPNCTFHIEDAHSSGPTAQRASDLSTCALCTAASATGRNSTAWASGPSSPAAGPRTLDQHPPAQRRPRGAGPPGAYLQALGNGLLGGRRTHQPHLRIANNGTMRKLILEAGFTGVVEHTYQVPVGSWTQEVAVIGRGCVSSAAGRPLWAVTSGQNVAIGLTLYGGQLSSNEDETVWP